jgi:hypothetical protein
MRVVGLGSVGNVRLFDNKSGHRPSDFLALGIPAKNFEAIGSTAASGALYSKWPRSTVIEAFGKV